MSLTLQTLARWALVGTVLIFITPTFAAIVYATPAGAGSQDGSSWANAYSQWGIQPVVDNLAAGDTLNLGSGTYTLPSLSITGHGSAENVKMILGVDTGGGLPLFQGTFDVANNAGGVAFMRFPGAADFWTIKNLRFKNQPWAIDMPVGGATYTVRTNITFENLAFDSIEDGIRLFNASHITVKSCTAIRYTKRGFRIGAYSAFVTFTGCSADCNGADDSFPVRSIPQGFHCEPGSVHDISFIDCTARSNRYKQPDDKYWNGDGFGSERGNYNISFLRCAGYDNDDAGFDNKADNITYRDCIAVGNKDGFRHWGRNGQMVNCVAAFNHKRGGSGGFYGIFVSKNNGELTANFVTVHNGDNSGPLFYVQPGGNGVATLNDSILSTTSGAAPFASGNVMVNRTATWRPGSGANPNYVAPDSTWRGTPGNAMDSQMHRGARGYNSERARVR